MKGTCENHIVDDYIPFVLTNRILNGYAPPEIKTICKACNKELLITMDDSYGIHVYEREKDLKK